jgi:hypothetical protein
MFNLALEKLSFASGAKDPEDLYEFLQECEEVYKEVTGLRRWWDDVFYVVNVDEILYGFMGAETTGDNSPIDVGWEFDEHSVCFVESYEVTQTKYRKINGYITDHGPISMIDLGHDQEKE